MTLIIDAYIILSFLFVILVVKMYALLYHFCSIHLRLLSNAVKYKTQSRMRIK